MSPHPGTERCREEQADQTMRCTWYRFDAGEASQDLTLQLAMGHPESTCLTLIKPTLLGIWELATSVLQFFSLEPELLPSPYQAICFLSKFSSALFLVQVDWPWRLCKGWLDSGPGVGWSGKEQKVAA
jgi:hypothetical protein